MTHECECDDANGFEYARVDDDGAAQLASRLGGYTERLCDDSHDYNDHAYEREAAGFGKLCKISQDFRRLRESYLRNIAI